MDGRNTRGDSHKGRFSWTEAEVINDNCKELQQCLLVEVKS